MELYRISAFSEGGQGGNPAGVVMCVEFPSDEEMQALAAEVGYSETAFAFPLGERHFRVRYFAPANEVPFCGHATIGTGSVLAELYGEGIYKLTLNDGDILVEARKSDEGFVAELVSPPTRNAPLSDDKLYEILDFLGWSRDVLREDFTPVLAATTQAHPVHMLESRETLAAMNYDFEQAVKVMTENDYCTVMLVFEESPQKFHVRNVFASGGVIEDPATGAAAAAFSGYLRDGLQVPFREIEIIQGEDMGAKSRIIARFGDEKGAPIRVSGESHKI